MHSTSDEPRRKICLSRPKKNGKSKGLRDHGRPFIGIRSCDLRGVHWESTQYLLADRTPLTWECLPVSTRQNAVRFPGGSASTRASSNQGQGSVPRGFERCGGGRPRLLETCGRMELDDSSKRIMNASGCGSGVETRCRSRARWEDKRVCR